LRSPTNLSNSRQKYDKKVQNAMAELLILTQRALPMLFIRQLLPPGRAMALNRAK